MTAVHFIREASISYGRREKVAWKIADSRVLAAFLQDKFGDKAVEHFVLVALDSRLKPLAWHTHSIGTETFSVVSPTGVFRFAILAGATHIMVAHNHPSGDATPSQEDIEMTRKLVEVGNLLGIKVLDHLVLGDDSYFSFTDAGMMPR